jgi:hypothetical protein
MRKLTALAMVFVSVSLFGCAGGRQGLWCAHYGTGLNDCSFYSFEQCQASISGNGGSCARNPFVTSPATQR